jgi:hypothetical protein
MAEFYVARGSEKCSVEFTSPAAPKTYRGNLMTRD